MPEPDLEESRKKVEKVYSETTGPIEKLWDSTLGRLSSSLKDVTSWLADKMSGFIDPSSTKQWLPLIAGAGLGGLSWLFTGNLFGSSTLGSILGFAAAGLAGFVAYKAFDIGSPTNTKVEVPKPPVKDVVKVTNQPVPCLTPDGRTEVKNYLTPFINRKVTMPLNIKYPELVKVKTDELKNHGKLTVETKGVKNAYQNWWEAVNVIRDGVFEYKENTRPQIVRELKTFGLTETDIELTEKLPKAPNPPSLIGETNDVSSELNELGKALCGPPEKWVTYSVSTKMNTLRDAIESRKKLIGKFKFEVVEDDWLGSWKMNEVLSHQYLIENIGAGEQTVGYHDTANRAIKALFDSTKKDQNNPRIDYKLALQLNELAWNGTYNGWSDKDRAEKAAASRKAAQDILAIAAKEELEKFEDQFYAPNCEKLEEFAKNGGELDIYNSKVSKMKENFEKLAKDMNEHKLAVITKGRYKNVDEEYVTIKDLAGFQFDKPETAVTKTLAFKKETDGRFLLVDIQKAYSDKKDPEGWKKPSTPVYVSNLEDAAELRKMLDALSVPGRMLVDAGKALTPEKPLEPKTEAKEVVSTKEPKNTDNKIEKKNGMGDLLGNGLNAASQLVSNFQDVSSQTGPGNIPKTDPNKNNNKNPLAPLSTGATPTV